MCGRPGEREAGERGLSILLPSKSPHQNSTHPYFTQPPPRLPQALPISARQRITFAAGSSALLTEREPRASGQSHSSVPLVVYNATTAVYHIQQRPGGRGGGARTGARTGRTGRKEMEREGRGREEREERERERRGGSRGRRGGRRRRREEEGRRQNSRFNF